MHVHPSGDGTELAPCLLADWQLTGKNLAMGEEE